MEALIVDLVAIGRTVDLPDECPHCSAKLKDTKNKRTINAWEYQDQRRPGGYDADEDGFEWDESYAGLPEGGESFLSYIAYCCASCGNLLSEGDMEIAFLGRALEDQNLDRQAAWRGAVASGETILGYHSWLGRKLEEEKTPNVRSVALGVE